MSEILNYLRSYRQIAPLPESDGALLQRFRLERDERAFATLVQRHGPLVLGIARRALGKIDAADDVFQATFLILARRGRHLETWPSVAGWLVEVARRTALQARSKAARRTRHEQQAATMTSDITNADPVQNAEQQDLAEMLDAELACLPSKYRTPLILCQLQGQTREETARQLGCPVGSVSGRLARGKKLLQERLIRRGLVPAIVAGAFSAPRLDAHVSNLLIQATTLLASNVVHKSSKVSACAAVTLAHGVMTTMLWTKLKYAAVAILMLGLCLGTGAWAWTGTINTAVAQLQSPEVTSDKKTLLQQIQGLWAIEQVVLPAISNETMDRLLQHYWRFDKDDLVTYHSSTDYIKHWPLQIDESYKPASIQLKTLMYTADLIGTINLSNEKLHLTVGHVSGNTRQHCRVVLRRVTDYDRLEGVWRKEERNPVTNELTEIDELIFRNNYLVRRSYSPAGPGAIGLQQEYTPSKFELHESLNPKGIDFDIRDENYYRTNQAGLFQDINKLNQRGLVERNLGIYQLTDNEFKFVITGRVPHLVQGDHVIPNPKSPDAIRGTSFDKTDKPVQVYKRFKKSLKDEMSANERSAYPQQQTNEQPALAQAPVSPQLQTLRQLRLKLAQERMSLWKQAQAVGNQKGSLEELGAISQQVLDASLALATDSRGKVRAVEEHLKALKLIEQYTEQGYKSGSKVKTDLLAAQLRRIEFEIQLEELKSKP